MTMRRATFGDDGRHESMGDTPRDSSTAALASSEYTAYAEDKGDMQEVDMAKESTAAGTAEARGVANDNAYGACEGPGGPQSTRATAEVAAWSATAATTAVAALDCEVAELQVGHHAREVSTKRGEATAGPPSGAAAPLEGSGCAGDIMPGIDSPQRWQPRLGVGPSSGREEDLNEDGGGPTKTVNVRRRDGTVAPLQVAALARGGGAATADLGAARPETGYPPQRTRRSYRVQRRGQRRRKLTTQRRAWT